jgi:FkbM family methyltransferase
MTSNLARSAVDCARYVRALGLRHGPATFASLRRPGNGLATVALPLARGPLCLRRGTADVRVFDQIFVMRDYDLRRFKHWQAIEKRGQEILKSGRRPLVIDCGANIGLSTVFLHALFPAASFVAIEPESGNFQVLRRNVSGYPNVVAMQAAISDQKGWVTISNPQASTWAFRVTDAPAETDAAIPAITIDEARAAVAHSELLAVKIDIEGAEERLFRSNIEWLKTTPLLIIELHDWMQPWCGSSRGFFRALAGLEFDFVLAGENALVFNWAACRS